MIKIKGVVHFSIPVSDLSKSRHFYTQLLGLDFIEAPPGSGMVFLGAGADYLVLCESMTPIKPNPGDEIRVHHAFKVEPEDYEQTKQSLLQKGIQILAEEDRKKGVFVGRQFYFHDPDHNVLEITESQRKK